GARALRPRARHAVQRRAPHRLATRGQGDGRELARVRAATRNRALPRGRDASFDGVTMPFALRRARRRPRRNLRPSRAQTTASRQTRRGDEREATHACPSGRPVSNTSGVTRSRTDSEESIDEDRAVEVRPAAFARVAAPGERRPRAAAVAALPRESARQLR